MNTMQATRPGSAEEVSYPVKVQEFARRLYEDGGWRICEIRGALAKRGYFPSQSTVSRWCSPELAEADRIKKRQALYPHLKGRKVTLPWEVKLQRMHELRNAGLSFHAVAKVMKLDYGIELDRHQSEAILKGRTSRALMARRLG